jgi:hypothetical protein
MSVSIYLICDETEQFVRIGDTASNRVSGALRPAVVAAFSRAHAERPLRTSLEALDWKSGNLGDEWTDETAASLYREITGMDMPAMSVSVRS